MKPLSSEPSESRPRSPPNRWWIATPEVPNQLTTACDVVNGSGVLPGRSFKPSLKPFRFTWNSPNPRPHVPFLVSSCSYAQHTLTIVTRSGSPVPTKVSRRRFLTTRARYHTSQAIPTPSHTRSHAQLKRLFLHIQTSRHFSSTTTSGRQAHPSQGMIGTRYKF